MLRLLPTLLVVALLLYCLVDCIQTPREAVRNLPKALWLVLIVLLAPFGPIGWLIAGRPDGSAAGPGGTPRRPQGPDDDPDFLRGLGREPRA